MDNLPVKKIFFYCIIFSLFGCSSTPLPRGGPVTVSEDFLGMAHAARTGTLGENFLLYEIGVKWVRETFSWGRVEIEEGQFDFTGYDVFTNAAKNEGLKIIAVLGFVPLWMFPEGKDKRYVSKENMPYFLNYVENTVRHFKGRVDVWEIWNEPNWTFWDGSDKEFFELTKQAAQKIKETDPDAYVIGGSFWRVPKNFIRGMNDAGAMENLDGIAFHPYAINPIGTMQLYDKFVDVMEEIGYTGAVWITEVGHPSSGWYPTRVSETEMPSCVIKTITGTAARGARSLIWYQLADGHNEGEATSKWNSEDFFGLAYQDFSKKSGAWAYALCSWYLSGSSYAPELPLRESIPSNVVSFCFIGGKAGDNVLILWNDRNNTEKIKLSFPSSSITIHDIASGLPNTTTNEIVLALRKEPVFITWQGPEIPSLSRIK